MKMCEVFQGKSLLKRVAIGKTMGFMFGLIGLLSIPYFLPEEGWHFRIGIMFWYMLLGVMVGFMGTWAKHPVLNFRMHPVFRGALIGGFLNLTLVLIAYEKFELIISSMQNTGGFQFQSPYCFIIEGIILGIIIDLVATKYAGEGNELK